MDQETPTPQLYMSDLGMSYTAHNEYQKKVIEVVRTYDRLLIDNPDNFVTSLKHAVDSLHAAYPRCRKCLVDPGYSRGHAKDDRHVVIWGLQNSTLVSISIKSIAGDFDQVGQ
jgi:hypothetical protein